jgi:HEAT repeat protein
MMMNKKELLSTIVEMGGMNDDKSLSEESVKKFDSILMIAENLLDTELIMPLISLFGYGEGSGIYWRVIHLLEQLPAEIVDPILINSLNSKRPGIRMWSALMLGRSRNKYAIKPLIRSLHDEFELVRRNAVIAIGMIGDPDSVKLLTSLSSDPSQEVRVEVQRILNSPLGQS